jgi:hypothetical protein
MSLREHSGGGWLVLILALAAPAGAAPEPALPDGSSPPPVPANAPAPATVNAATSPAPKARPRLSPQIMSQISSAVPVWSPLPEKPAEKPPPPPDPEVVKMAPVVVWGDRLPRTDEIDLLTPKARDVELVKRYITPFDRYFLNRLTLPIVGISKEARARMMYEEDKRLQDMKWINDQIDQVKVLDPEEARSLQKVRNTTFTRSEP